MYRSINKQHWIPAFSNGQLAAMKFCFSIAIQVYYLQKHRLSVSQLNSYIRTE